MVLYEIIFGDNLLEGLIEYTGLDLLEIVH